MPLRIELLQQAIKVGVRKINNAIAHRIRCSLTSDSVNNGRNRPIRVLSNEIQCFTKVDDKVSIEYRYISCLLYTSDAADDC